jgi:hypothetical protein
VHNGGRKTPDVVRILVELESKYLESTVIPAIDAEVQKRRWQSPGAQDPGLASFSTDVLEETRHGVVARRPLTEEGYTVLEQLSAMVKVYDMNYWISDLILLPELEPIRRPKGARVEHERFQHAVKEACSICACDS